MQVLPEMEKDVRKLKSLLDKASKITELKKELLWAQVIEFEKVSMLTIFCLNIFFVFLVELLLTYPFKRIADFLVPFSALKNVKIA